MSLVRSDIRPLELSALLYVAHHARPESERDVRATAGNIGPDAFAINRIQAPGTAWSFHDADGVPYMVAGLESDRPGVATWWLASTAGLTEKHALTVARFGRNAVRTLLASGELHRIQAFVLADWPQACRLAEAIGLQRESVMRAAGIRLEDIAVYATTRHEQAVQEEGHADDRQLGDRPAAEP